MSIVVTEADILAGVMASDQPTLSQELARSVLTWRFSDDQKRRIRELADKARQGKLTPDERDEADRYERVGSFLALLQSKARVSLRQSPL